MDAICDIYNNICSKRVSMMGFPSGSVVKNPPAKAGNTGLIHGSERSSREGNDNPLQYSCLENPMGRGAWQGYSACSCKRVRHNLLTKQQQSQEYACGDVFTSYRVWSFFLSVITGYHEMLSIELNYHVAQEFFFPFII